MKKTIAVFLFALSASFMTAPIHIAINKSETCIGDLTCLTPDQIPMVVMGCMAVGLTIAVLGLKVLLSGKKKQDG